MVGAVGQGDTHVAPQHLAHPDDVLDEEGPVETQLLPLHFESFAGGLHAEPGDRRVPRCEAYEGKNHKREDDNNIGRL